jgi:hypothetical protein
MKKTAICLYWRSLWINLGWFPGDPLKLIDVSLGEIDFDYKTNKVDHVTLFSFQVVYFSLCFGWRKAG